MAIRERVIGRDLPLRLCRVGFILLLAGLAAVWWRLNADDRFYAILIALAGSFAVGLSRSFQSLCSTVAVFGGIVVGLALFTLVTGYSVGYHRVRVVENVSGIQPLIVGMLILGLALLGKTLARRA